MNHHDPGVAWGIDYTGDLPIWILVGSLAYWYLTSTARLKRKSPSQPWAGRYSWCFLIGLAWFTLVTTGPIAYVAMTYFCLHMVQHLVLMMLASPLIVMGAPVLLLLRANPAKTRRKWILPVLRSRVFGIATNPVVSWLVFAGVLIGVHFSPLMSWLMDVGLLGRYLEYGLYVTVAFMYYYALLPGNPAVNRISPAARVFSLFLMMIPETMTGFFIYSAEFPLFPYFVRMSSKVGADPVADQQLGGALMWSTGMIIDVAWIAVAVHEWFGSETIKTRRLDGQIQREMERGKEAGS